MKRRVVVATSHPHNPVAEIEMGTVNSFTSWVFRNGQCLGLALALADLLPGSRVVAVVIDPLDELPPGRLEEFHLGTADAYDWPQWVPFVSHVCVETRQGRLLDSAGEHDALALIESQRRAHGGASALYLTRREAEHLLQTFPSQHWDAGRAFAKALLRQRAQTTSAVAS